MDTPWEDADADVDAAWVVDTCIHRAVDNFQDREGAYCDRRSRSHLGSCREKRGHIRVRASLGVADGNGLHVRCSAKAGSSAIVIEPWRVVVAVAVAAFALGDCLYEYHFRCLHFH